MLFINPRHEMVHDLDRQRLHDEQVPEPDVSLPLQRHAVQVDPGQVPLAPHQLVQPVQLLVLVILQVLTHVVLVLPETEHQRLQNVQDPW